MLTSELKPAEEILGYLREGERVFLVACGGCAEVCRSGGEEALTALREVVGNARVTGAVSLPFLCNKALVAMRLGRWAEGVAQAEALLVASCGVGVQAVAEVVDKMAYPAANTTTFGAFRGVWPSAEQCVRCGDCVLGGTGGICPLTVCPKGLLHGPCGGSHEGGCELERGRPCGWQKIHDRLEKLGRLDLLDRYRGPKDRRRQLDVPSARRRTIFWALEFSEEE